MPYLPDDGEFVFQFVDTGATVPVIGWLPIGDGFTLDMLIPVNPVPFSADRVFPDATIADLQTRTAEMGVPSQVTLQFPSTVNASLPATWAMAATQFTALSNASDRFAALSKGLGTVEAGITLQATIVTTTELATDQDRSATPVSASVSVGQSAVLLVTASSTRKTLIICNCSSNLIYLGLNSLVSQNFYWRRLLGGETIDVPNSLASLEFWGYGTASAQVISIVSA